MMRMTAGNRDGKYQKENESYKWFRRQVSLSKVGVEETKGETSQRQRDGDRDRDRERVEFVMGDKRQEQIIVDR